MIHTLCYAKHTAFIVFLATNVTSDQQPTNMFDLTLQSEIKTPLL